MAPTLRSGDLVFVDVRAPWAEGDVVAADHPTRTDLSIVKRIEFLDEQGRLFLRSDNDEAGDATDSRTFGPVPGDHVIGRISSRLGSR